MKLVIGFITAILFLTVLTTVSAHHKQCGEDCPLPSPVCDNGEHEGNPHCITETPISSPSATLEPSVEVTESPVPTNTPPSEANPGNIPENPSDGRSDGRSDGLSSSPQPTLTPCVISTCGWK